MEVSINDKDKRTVVKEFIKASRPIWPTLTKRQTAFDFNKFKLYQKRLLIKR